MLNCWPRVKGILAESKLCFFVWSVNIVCNLSHNLAVCNDVINANMATPLEEPFCDLLTKCVLRCRFIRKKEMFSTKFAFQQEFPHS